MDELRTRLQALHSIAEKIISLSGSTGASLGVLHNGEIKLTENFGFQDHSRRQRATSDTLYNIGSLTKSMVAQAAGSGLDESLVAWNTPVSSLIPEFHNVDRAITEQCSLVDLLSHRTGLPTANVLWYQGGSKSLVNKKDLLPLVNAMSPTFSFRSSWRYSNWGYSLAAAVLERVTGQPWQMIVKKRLWDPLEMKHTTTEAMWKSLPNAAQGFMALEDASTFAVDAQAIDDSSIMGPAGGVCSNVNELFIYYCALLEAYKHRNEDNSHSISGSPFKHVPTVFSAHSVLPYPTVPAYNDTTYGFGWARGYVPGALGIISDNSGMVQSMPIIGRGALPQQLRHRVGELCDSADWLAQMYLDSLLGSPNINDFIRLTEECIQVTRSRFSEAEETLSKERVSGTVLKPLEQYCGRYYWESRFYFIDVCFDGEDLQLIIQGREDQSYKLKHYHYDTFTWLMAHDEEAKRGRFIQSTYTYKIVFSCDEHHNIVSFTWQDIGGGKALLRKENYQ
ncbi:beta-lactamase/transpeptidase-like protein [Talaromyces proteolyticus]|uniref:Beta-lactamase/transpeptidase-like protein n=1 Tax=Talaromyces proteolyticus TaxID=1131652 RepID=A0AAD4KTS4_9EURO|nr:beta-lactamase/transpeptidase-like protein [Talaromyces proteolyticus]KAH8700722.1 beta-lactamase/transpeptidase-like protein [Talaromyces proteolyticus]